MVTHHGITVGQQRRTVNLPGVRLIEASYPGGLFVPPHSHTTTNITVVLAGGLEETSQGRTQRCAPGSVVIKPAGTTHANRFSPAGARTLVVELLSNHSGSDAPFDTTWDYGWESGGALARSMVRLFATFCKCDIETLSAEVGGVLDSLCGDQGSGRDHLPVSAPAWLEDLRALIDDRVSSPLRVKDLARVVGMHPVYLTRIFRRFHGASVTEYIHQRQVARVATMLAKPNAPLSEIAADSGFADQSHMTRTFKSQMGVTPGAFRRLLG